MKAEDLDGPRVANRNIGKAVTNRNKYFLLEQERSNQVIGGRGFDRREEGGGKQHELQQGVESSQSYNTFGNSSSNDHLRLRMNRVDRFNSAMEASPKRGGVSLSTIFSLYHMAVNLLWTAAPELKHVEAFFNRHSYSLQLIWVPLALLLSISPLSLSKYVAVKKMKW